MAAAVTPTPFTPGFRLVDGSDLNTNFGHPILSSQDGITAHAGGGQTNAFQLTTRVNRLTTVATTADSYKLVKAVAGKQITVVNDGANAAQAFGQGTDTINDVATATGIVHPAGETFTFSCTTAGKWYVTSGLGESGAVQATTLTASSTVTLSPTNASVTMSPGGTGTVVVNPNTAGTIDNEVIGATTPLAGTFTTLTATGHTTFEGVTSTGATGTGRLVYDNTPTLITPTIGVATATSVNKVAITAPATSATLTIANGKTLTANNTLTLAGTDSTTMTFPPTTGTVAATTGSNLYSPDGKRCSGSVTANGTITYANVTGLSWTVVPGTYIFEMDLPSTVANGTGGIKYAFNYTTTVLSSIEATGLGYTASAVAVQHTTTTTTQTDLFTQAAVVIYTRLIGSCVVGTGGTIDLQMAQNTSNASNTVTLVGAVGKFIRIA